ncbi:hypothetical protein [Nocardioides taihuensis]|uniref:Uncharacterized protein n=1 Tax=Nocardioides taihuensis TaxID=1835606 RepID=A0ABW0BJ77_9ACTN
MASLSLLRTIEEPPRQQDEPQPTAESGVTRVLVLSTSAFTLMFAVRLMFGILGKPVSAEFGLIEVQPGDLGRFSLPVLFAHTKVRSGFPSSTDFVFFVLTVICLLWMHSTAVHMLHTESSGLARPIERPSEAHEEELV